MSNSHTLSSSAYAAPSTFPATNAAGSAASFAAHASASGFKAPPSRGKTGAPSALLKPKPVHANAFTSGSSFAVFASKKSQRFGGSHPFAFASRISSACDAPTPSQRANPIASGDSSPIPPSE